MVHHETAATASLEVRLGEPLPWSVRDESTRLLLSRGYVIESEEQLEELLTRGAFVDIEEARAVAHQDEMAAQERANLSALKRPQNLFSLWDQTAQELRQILGDQPESAPPPGQITDFSARLMALVDQDVDMALYHVVRQESAHLYYYGYNHAIHTAVLCLLMARRLQWPQARLLSLMHAALTMNLSILQLQGVMAEQDEPMRESQKIQIQAHPELAVRWLSEAGVTDGDWLAAIAQHHEHADGTGYPQGARTPATWPLRCVSPMSSPPRSAGASCAPRCRSRRRRGSCSAKITAARSPRPSSRSSGSTHRVRW